MKAHYVIVELREPAKVKSLQSLLDEARAEIERLKRELRVSEQRFGWEVNLNNELIDLCREYKVPFRETLDHSRHPF